MLKKTVFDSSNYMQNSNNCVCKILFNLLKVKIRFLSENKNLKYARSSLLKFCIRQILISIDKKSKLDFINNLSCTSKYRFKTACQSQLEIKELFWFK